MKRAASTRDQVASFMYHEVTDDPLDSGYQRRGARAYTRTPADLERHLDLIADAGIAPSRVDEVMPDRPGGELLLTFDDGGRSARAAADALAQRGWPGHFFIVTDLIGHAGFVTAADIRALHDDGHVVGSHSVSHPDIFNALSPREMREEWTRSKQTLEQLLGVSCDVASLPGGDYSREVAAAATAAGVRTLFTSEPWQRPQQVEGCWLFGRFAVRRSLSDEAFAELVCGRGWHRALARRRFGVAARHLFGPLYRLYVRYSTTRHTPLATP